MIENFFRKFFRSFASRPLNTKTSPEPFQRSLFPPLDVSEIFQDGFVFSMKQYETGLNRLLPQTETVQF